MLKGECQRESISEKEDVDLRKREEVKHEVIERRKEEREKRRRERERERERGREGGGRRQKYIPRRIFNPLLFILHPINYHCLIHGRTGYVRENRIIILNRFVISRSSKQIDHKECMHISVNPLLAPLSKYTTLNRCCKRFVEAHLCDLSIILKSFPFGEKLC